MKTLHKIHRNVTYWFSSTGPSCHQKKDNRRVNISFQCWFTGTGPEDLGLHSTSWKSMGMLPNGDWAQSKSALGQPAVCGILTLWRKDLTTQVQVILRVFIKAEDGETKEGLMRKATAESLGCFGSLGMLQERNEARQLLWLTRNKSHSDRSEPRQGCC